MNLSRPLTRRLAAVVVGAVLGLTGAMALSGPASADHPVNVSGSCQWQPDPAGWNVTWTVSAPGAGPYQLTVTPDGSLDGTDLTGVLPESGELTAVQQLDPDAESASLTVTVEWDDGHQVTADAEVAIPGDCAEVPESPAELGEWTANCEWLTVTIDNPAEEDLALRLVPSTGEPVNVEVAGGQSATVQFPASEGLSVDVHHQGRSIVDPETPIEITPAAWAERGCGDEADGDGGALAATGTRTALIVAGAVLLLAAGAGLFLVAHRRRIIFTTPDT